MVCFMTRMRERNRMCDEERYRGYSVFIYGTRKRYKESVSQRDSTYPFLSLLVYKIESGCVMKRGREMASVCLLLCVTRKVINITRTISKQKYQNHRISSRAVYRNPAKMEHRCLFWTVTLQATLFHFLDRGIHWFLLVR